jgi:hypothetical protein
MSTGRRVVQWIFGRQQARPPREGHVVELAWLPLWQAQLVLHHLWEADVPVTLSEDYTSQLRFSAREPMAHLYVMEPRLAAARAAMAEVMDDR